jgi:hypothetical protein
MKNLLLPIFALMLIITSCTSCDNEKTGNTSALEEQMKTEANQRDLNAVQPAPKISWSLERDNLIKRFKLQNDRSISFYMYVFVEGVGEPIGYYQVNKVSSVNSQLTNTEQIVVYSSPNHTDGWGQHVLPSPAEDGSYGTNGDAVFGFTPEDIYIEHNMHYMVSTVPLSFSKPVNRLTIINVETEKELKAMMDKIR